MSLKTLQTVTASLTPLFRILKLLKTANYREKLQAVCQKLYKPKFKNGKN